MLAPLSGVPSLSDLKGQLNGNINAKDRIEMKSTARVMGDIRAKRLHVEDGVTFVGKSEVNPSGGPVTASEPPSREPDGADKKGDDKGGLFNKK